MKYTELQTIIDGNFNFSQCDAHAALIRDLDPEACGWPEYAQILKRGIVVEFRTIEVAQSDRYHRTERVVKSETLKLSISRAGVMTWKAVTNE